MERLPDHHPCFLHPRLNTTHCTSARNPHPPTRVSDPALAFRLPPDANPTRIVIFGLARRWRAPRVPKDEHREHGENQQHAEHAREQRARVHVPSHHARKTERADGDGEGEDRPEQRCQREREEA